MAQYPSEYSQHNAPPPPGRRWPLAGVMSIDLVIGVIAALVFAGIIQFIILLARASAAGVNVLSGTPDQQQLLALIGADGLFVSILIQNAVFVAIPIIRMKLIRREPLAELGFRFQPFLRLTLIGIGLGVVVLVVNGLASAAFRAAGIQQNQSAQYPLFRGDYTGQVLFFISAAIFAPIGEEVLFRGYVFNAIRKTFQQRRWMLPVAYIISAGLFSLIHIVAVTQDAIGLLFPAFLIGLLFVWGVHRTGSLLPAIIAHAINNGVGVAVLIACVNNPGMEGCPPL